MAGSADDNQSCARDTGGEGSTGTKSFPRVIVEETSLQESMGKNKECESISASFILQDISIWPM